MTISKTAYDTTTHAGYVTRKTEDALRAALAVGALRQLGAGMSVVQDGDNYRNAIPAFVHPMPYGGIVTSEKDHVSLAVDLRPFGTYSRSQEDFIVRNTIEARFAILRLRLNRVWLNESPTYLRNISSIPLKVFANWFSESLSRRFALEPLGQMRLTILAAVFYNSLFTNETDMDEDDRIKVSGVLARELNVLQTDVLDVIDQVPVVTSLKHFCDVAADVTQAIQLKELKDNVGLLVAVMGSGWFGANYKEVLAAALEHPPTWIAICYTAGTDRSYRNTNIARIFERHSKGNADQLFFNALDKMLGTMAPMDTQPYIS